MKKNVLYQQNLLNIRPGNIIIENFIPGKIYRRAIEIENTSKIPIIINLKSSDKSKLLLSKTLLRLEIREKKVIELIIKDQLEYSDSNYPINPKIIYINIKGELIEAKFMINLIYYPKKNQYKKITNYNTIQIESINNEFERQIPSFYLTNYQKPLYNKNFMNSRKLLIDKTNNLFFQRYENNLVRSLKNQIKYLKHQNFLLTQQNKKLSINNPRNYKIGNFSYFILKNKLEDPKGQFKLENDLEIKALKNKNEALKIENNILVERIKDLENIISNNNNEFKKYDLLKDNDTDIENKERNNNEIDNDVEYNDQEEKHEIQNEKNFYIDDNIKNNINFYDEFFIS